jgi:hypothetical protein
MAVIDIGFMPWHAHALIAISAFSRVIGKSLDVTRVMFSAVAARV